MSLKLTEGCVQEVHLVVIKLRIPGITDLGCHSDPKRFLDDLANAVAKAQKQIAAAEKKGFKVEGPWHVDNAEQRWCIRLRKDVSDPQVESKLEPLGSGR